MGMNYKKEYNETHGCLKAHRFVDKAMFSLSKRRFIAGAWTCAGAAACAKMFSNHRKYQDLPCVELALSRLEAEARVDLGSPLKLGMWPRQSHVDSNAGLMRASFKVNGPKGMAHILVGARRDRLEEIEAEEDDRDGYYWLRPWELKKAFLDRIHSIRARPEDQDASMWRLETLVVLREEETDFVLGNPLSLPEYEAVCLRRDGGSKDERSRRRLHIALGISLIATVLAGGVRLFRARYVWQSHGSVRKAVLADQSIQTVLGPSHIESCTGTFTSTYINAQLKLVGKTGAADVIVAATRDSTWQQWRVAVARMNVGGVSCNLDLALTH